MSVRENRRRRPACAWLLKSIVLCFFGVACGGGGSGTSDAGNDSASGMPGPITSIEELGRALFFESNLSLNRTQSCASCHDPSRAFSDSRPNAVGGAASLGDDGTSLGQRNTPTLTYAMFSPSFGPNASGLLAGGQFLDGRVPDLATQAGIPPLGALEMGLPDVATAVARIQENPSYVAAFQGIFGDDIFNNPDNAFAGFTQAVAAFEMTAEFASFDSKYDRFLAGEYQMTEQESLGRALFFSPQFTNCSTCHQLQSFGGSRNETFSNYEFHNIGVPRNDVLLAANNGLVDAGLAENPAAADASNAGKFKTPTLRNVAVTAPYMHNGVFRDLRTVILFYDKFNNPARTSNPETGQAWRSAEYPETVNTVDLESSSALSDEDVDALVAFLHTLTDRRFETPPQ